jgi:hypothetical protein
LFEREGASVVRPLELELGGPGLDPWRLDPALVGKSSRPRPGIRAQHDVVVGGVNRAAQLCQDVCEAAREHVVGAEQLSRSDDQLFVPREHSQTIRLTARAR